MLPTRLAAVTRSAAWLCIVAVSSRTCVAQSLTAEMVLKEAKESFKKKADLTLAKAANQDWFPHASKANDLEIFKKYYAEMPGKSVDLAKLVPLRIEGKDSNGKPYKGEYRVASLKGIATPGDVFVLKIGQAFVPVVYAGEERFPDASQEASFFIYPWTCRLEYNTLPPRTHRAVLDNLWKHFKTLEPDRWPYVSDPTHDSKWVAHSTFAYLPSPTGLVGQVPVFHAAASMGGSNKDVWVYHQSTGKLTLNGKLVATGYSGIGKGLNNPEEEATKNVGPIPRGKYIIGEPSPHEGKAPPVMRLTPNGHKAHDRKDFLIHGDNTDINHSASNGCIILGKEARQTIAGSKLTDLLVDK